MEKDSGKALQKLQVDGGMTKNELLMQIQADFNGIEVVRPKFTETTSMGSDALGCQNSVSGSGVTGIISRGFSGFQK